MREVFLLLFVLSAQTVFGWNDTLRDLAIAQKRAGPDPDLHNDPIAVGNQGLAWAAAGTLSQVQLHDPDGFKDTALAQIGVTEIQEIFTLLRTGNLTLTRRDLTVKSLVELFARVDTSVLSQDTDTYQGVLADWLPSSEIDIEGIQPEGALAENLFSLLEVCILYWEASQSFSIPRKRDKYALVDQVSVFVHNILPQVILALAKRTFHALQEEGESTVSALRLNKHTTSAPSRLQVLDSIEPYSLESTAADRIVATQLLGYSFRSLLVSIEKVMGGKKPRAIQELLARFQAIEEPYQEIIRKRYPIVSAQAQKRLESLQKDFDTANGLAVTGRHFYIFVPIGIAAGTLGFGAFSGFELSTTLWGTAIGAFVGLLAFFLEYGSGVPRMENAKSRLDSTSVDTERKVFASRIENELLDQSKGKTGKCDFQSALTLKKALLQ